MSIGNITSNPEVMGGKACVRNTRVSVSLILNLIANGMTAKDIINEYPVLNAEDISQCLNYAAYLADEELYAIQR